MTYPFFAQIVSAFSAKEKFTKYSQPGLKTSAGKATWNVPRESGATDGTSNAEEATALPFSSSSHEPANACASVKPKRFQRRATPVWGLKSSTTRLRWTWPTSTSFAVTLRKGSTTPFTQNGPSFGTSS